jgi:hypothetical protein
VLCMHVKGVLIGMPGRIGGLLNKLRKVDSLRLDSSDKRGLFAVGPSSLTNGWVDSLRSDDFDRKR